MQNIYCYTLYKCVTCECVCLCVYAHTRLLTCKKHLISYKSSGRIILSTHIIK